MKLNKPKLVVNPFILLFISILAVAISSILIKSSNTPPSVAGMYRLYITVLILLPFVSWKKLNFTQLTKKDWSIIFLAGFFLGLHFLFWMESLSYTSVASSMVILTLQPLFVMIGSYFIFKERVSKLKALCMVTAVFGSLIIAWGDIGVSRGAIIGDVLSLLGTISISVYMLAGQKVSQNISANVYSIIVFFLGGSVMLIYSLVNNFNLTDYRSSDWIYFFVLAVIPTIFGHLIFNLLLKSMGATTVSVGVIGEPVLAIILAFFLLGEAVTSSQITGGLFTIVSMGVYFYLKSNK
ncbi:Permease of the drug/metabolite transporter (DMT) superfamily [Paenibacillus sp. 1_12]|uniref:DMT family transporter n=1 Tax=Paenibacillus sp. 1_12 TaxID=1566278 RepID=UPI0008F417E0|nr:DMT family transporter [Paenibacillus sp. 1_12]SFM26679.1 Permease of the drug/metabolite transporter (DMT) superfamily [Paenibacillus sp. 1_12]